MADLYVLGVTVGHDSGACLTKNGRIVAAIGEERLARVKNYEGFPARSIAWLLRNEGIDGSRLAGVGIAGVRQHLEAPIFFYRQQAGRLGTLARIGYSVAARAAALTGSDHLRGIYFNEAAYRSFAEGELRRVGVSCGFRTYDHHESHAASAFWGSPFDEALVLTQDGRGDLLSGSVSHGRGTTLARLVAQPADDSLAQLYAGVTKFVGFKPLRHEGKITGLAAFGKRTPLAEDLRSMFSVDKTGELRRDVGRHAAEISWPERSIESPTERSRRLAGPSAYADYHAFADFFRNWLTRKAAGVSREDLAHAIQWVCEDVMVAVVRNLLDNRLRPAAPIDVCLAGGLFANVRINQEIQECHPLVKNVYVKPAMGDNGLSIGAAMLEHRRIAGDVRPEPLPHVYLGCAYSDSEIERTLAAWPSLPKFRRSDDIAAEVAQLLVEGKIVGWFQGAMEFGPRALGNRSIVIRPIDRSINDEVNRRLRRTEFMPFAPSALDSRAADYFEGWRPDHVAAEFMTVTYDVKESMREQIQAVVHVDGTARPQVVREAVNPLYHRLLREYDRLTGIGCVVNTSFNMHEEPIVASPEDALRSFDVGAVDHLALGSFLVSKD